MFQFLREQVPSSFGRFQLCPSLLDYSRFMATLAPLLLGGAQLDPLLLIFRYSELVAIHGKLDPLVNVDLTPEKRVKVTFTYGDLVEVFNFVSCFVTLDRCIM